MNQGKDSCLKLLQCPTTSPAPLLLTFADEILRKCLGGKGRGAVFGLFHSLTSESDVLEKFGTKNLFLPFPTLPVLLYYLK